MNFNKLKRKAFFWIEKLQISRTERIGIVLLLGIVILLLTASLFLNRSFNYDQQEYDEILAEFEKRSATLEKEENILAEKYTPQPLVNTSKESVQQQESSMEIDEPAETEVVPEIININTANALQLQNLGGIGPAYANNIIEYREANGPFEDVEELLNVKGIGEKRLENILPFIKLEN